jgi:hypothetical protein
MQSILERYERVAQDTRYVQIARWPAFQAVHRALVLYCSLPAHGLPPAPAADVRP